MDECVSIKGLGFRRGSYKCVCQKGFYFRDAISNQSYFEGSVVEEEYEKLMMGDESIYNETNSFECLPCSEGCETCTDAKPCVVTLNWLWRSVVLSLTCIVIILLFAMEFMTWKYRNLKIIRAASPLLLRVIAFGAFLIYCTTIVMYPVPTLVTCTMKNWLRELGFSITYGALMLKTWRIAVIFQVRSAKTVKITDTDLLKKLGIIVLVFSTFLTIRTLVAPPNIKVGITADNLKAYLCETNWWDRWFSFMEAVFLAWGVRLCLSVRKAPSQFNESRYISFTIYNEFCMSTIFTLLMVYFQIPANPDIEYVISFAHTQITITVLLCFIFGSKAYLILTGGGREVASSHICNAKSPSSKFLSKPSLPASSQTFPSSTSINVSAYGDRLVIQEDELQSIFAQVDSLREKNAKNGSRELTVKLNRIYECVLKTMSEVCVEDESSSSNVAHERLADEQQRPHSSYNSVDVRLVAIGGGGGGGGGGGPPNTRLAGGAKIGDGRSQGHKAAGARCRLRRYFCLESPPFGHAAGKSEVDLKLESARMHAIILNDEQLSQCKQVSL
ncbi:hypothetical protein V9T40_008290 [Parthenolecanium corni]|uniref:G-protein coupled receptors family 3 profile domain-containing protein n=1 Tax=Parthenolecanium corni TaxID=536013 RepID=A0AAN9TKL9_9HEMI